MVKYIKCYKRLVEHSASLLGEKGLLKIFMVLVFFFVFFLRFLRETWENLIQAHLLQRYV